MKKRHACIAFPGALARRAGGRLLLLLLAAAGGVLAGPAPRDCAGMEPGVEWLICRNDALAALDRQMEQTYQVAMRRLPAEEARRRAARQQAWIGARDDCWQERDDREGCLDRWYRRRITELQILSGQRVVPEPASYRCDGGRHDSLTAYFYDQAPAPVAVLNRINGTLDQQDFAWLADWEGRPAYVGKHAILRRAGDRLTGNWDEKPLDCHRR